jgi:hypothetical protein
MTQMVLISKDELRCVVIEAFMEFLKSKNGTPLEILETDEDRANDRINQKDFCSWLGITESTAIRWRKTGKIECENIPGSSKIWYSKSKVRELLKKNPKLLQAARK